MKSSDEELGWWEINTLWVLFLVVKVRADQPGDNTAWAVSVLMQPPPHARLVGAFILCWSGQGLCYALLWSRAQPGGDAIPAVPESSPGSTWWPTGRTSQWVHRQSPSAAVTFISPAPVLSCLYSLPRNRNVSGERWMGLVIKYPPLWTQPCVHMAMVCKLLTPNMTLIKPCLVGALSPAGGCGE